MEIIKASETNMEGILSLCKDCSQNMVNNLIDQWDDFYPNKEIFLADIRHGHYLGKPRRGGCLP